MRQARKRDLRFFLVFLSMVALQVWGDEFIAGVEPSARPFGAPILTEYPKDAAWYCVALTGVEQPYPVSLRFLEDQGAWHNPFVRPGMTGPYDLRQWHAPASASCGTGRTVSGR